MALSPVNGLGAAQIVKPGYFDYKRDGFGPVIPTAEGLVERIILLMENNFAQDESYSRKADKFFTLRDGQNCRRIYEAILEKS